MPRTRLSKRAFWRMIHADNRPHYLETQRHAVYRWGTTLLDAAPRKRLTQAEMRDAVIQIWRAYRDDEPPVCLFDRRLTPWPRAGSTFIAMPKWRYAIILVHELAHALIGRFDTRRGPAPMSHGPLFMAVTIELYRRWLGMDRTALRKCAHLMGITVGRTPTWMRT